MSLNLSPNPAWDIILSSLGFTVVFFVFLILPLTYIFIGRPFDKKFTLKYYFLEKGFWHLSVGFRLGHYVYGIFLQPYRYRKIKNKLFSETVKRRFIYQDKLYGKVIDFRACATKWQIMLANLSVIGFVIMLVMLILFMFHDFVLYPN